MSATQSQLAGAEVTHGYFRYRGHPSRWPFYFWQFGRSQGCSLRVVS